MTVKMRDYQKELEQRVAFIQQILRESHAQGIVFGNSGGKDSALVGILCKKACENTLGVMMPCQSKRNFGEDMDDGRDLASQFGIASVTVDLTAVKAAMTAQVETAQEISAPAAANIAPRLRMTALYAIAQSRNSLVAGTGNRSERYMGYFTKWGDGAFDFNPIADLTVTEIYEFLTFLNAPANIIQKAPSAGLFEGQTDEQEMGVTYAQIDQYIADGSGDPRAVEIIESAHRRTAHKLAPANIYEGAKPVSGQ